MTRKDIVDCFDNVKATEIQKQKMLNNILASKNTEVIPMRKRTRFSVALVAAVLTVLILGTGTVLAATLGWHTALLSHFNPTAEQVELLDDTVGTPDISITRDGLTISVLQSLADSFGVYILYEIVVDDEAFVFPEEMLVGARLFRSGDSGDGVTSGSDEAVILENSRNRLTVLQQFHSTAPTTNENVSLLVFSLSYITDEWDYDGRLIQPLFEDLFADNEWVFRWELDFVHMGTTLLPNVTVEYSGAVNTVTEIVISPLSAMIFFEGDRFHPNSTFVSINKSDGTTIVFGAECEGAMFIRVPINAIPGVECDNPDGGFSQSLHFSFDSVINVEDVESITIGDVVIPMER